MSDMMRATKLAITAHADQVCKGGRPYMEHVIRVAVGSMTYAHPEDQDEAFIVGMLHDVVEDTWVTFDTLRKSGFSEGVIAAVDSVTKRKGHETNVEYLGRVSENVIGLAVKLADNDDNGDEQRIAALDDEAMRDRLTTKYAKARVTLDKARETQ